MHCEWKPPVTKREFHRLLAGVAKKARFWVHVWKPLGTYRSHHVMLSSDKVLNKQINWKQKLLATAFSAEKAEEKREVFERWLQEYQDKQGG